MKKVFALILLLAGLVIGYATPKTWSQPIPSEPVATSNEDAKQKLIHGEFCHILSQAECFKVFTGLYDLKQSSFVSGTSTLRATGSFVYWPKPGEYDYSSMPRHIENFEITCDLSKNTCRYLGVKTVSRIENKFNEATNTFEPYPNYYQTDTGVDQTFKIFKKDKDMVSAEYSYAPQECGIDRLVIKLDTKEVIRLRSSACESKDFLTDSQEDAV